MFTQVIFTALAFVISFLPQPTWREGVVGQPKTLNPLTIGTNQNGRDISSFVFRSLLAYNSQGDLVPDLSEKYEISVDKKEYVFHLQKNVYWHDGKKFNADDVIYTVSQQNLQTVEVDKLDDHTVKFRLVRDSFTPFLDLMTQKVLRSQFTKNGREKLGAEILSIGNGDFRVSRIKRSNKIDSIILTKAWPWTPNQYGFSRVIFNFYNNEEEVVTAARLGEIDGFGLTSNAPAIDNYSLVSSPVGSRFYGLFFNLEKENLKDNDLRRYLKNLIDQKNLISKVFGGQAVAAYSPLERTFVPEVSPENKTANLPIPASLKPKDGQEKLITLTIPDNKETKNYLLEVANFVKETWQSDGLKIEFKMIPLAKILTEVIAKKDFEVLLFGQEVRRDPDVYTLWHSTQKNLPGLNFTSYGSVLTDKALEEGRQESIREERIRHYLNFIKAFNEDTPVIFLYRPLYTYSFKKNISGPSLEGFFFPEDRFLNFKFWRRS